MIFSTLFDIESWCPFHVAEQVCKFFLDAVEKKQYGWFWVCPNGGKDCHYRHALPQGYVLKSQMKALLEEEAEKISIEEEIENQVCNFEVKSGWIIFWLRILCMKGISETYIIGCMFIEV